MASKSVESSSDLTRAREISRRLADDDRSAAPAIAPAHRFSAQQVYAAAGLPAPQPPPAAASGAAPRTPAAPAAPAAPAPRVLPPLPPGGGWDALVAWSRSAIGAEYAFLMDEQGLLVAMSGKIDPRDAEGIGGRLVYIFEQADEMRGGPNTARSVLLEFGGASLSGWRVPISGGNFLSLGMISTKPFPSDAQAVIGRAFAAKRS